VSAAIERDGLQELVRRMLILACFGAWLVIRTKSQGLVTFARERWHAEQVQFETQRTGMDLVLKPRQIGFTTLELARDVQRAVTRHGYAVLIVAHTHSAKKGLFRAVRMMVDGLVERGLCPEPDFNTVDEIVFTSRASSIRVIEAGATEVSAEDKGRSGTINRLHLTELAFYRKPKATLKALLGAMPKDGTEEVVIESTPNGAAGLFYDMVTDALAGRGRYRLHFFAWYQHAEYRRAVLADFDPAPRDKWEQALRARGCDDEQIAWWRERVSAREEGGLEGALQEFPIDAASCFRLLSGAYMANEVVDYVARHIVQPIRTERAQVRVQPDGGGHDVEKWPLRDFGEVQIFGELAGGRQAIVTGDVAEGGGGDADYLVGRARDRRTFELLASFRSNTITPGDFGVVLAWIGHRFGRCEVAPERNKDGVATLDRMQTQRTSVTPYPRIYKAEDGKLGWLTSPKTRPIMWDGLRAFMRDAALEERAGRFFDADLSAEVRTLVLLGGRPEAQSGAHDDVFTADAIANELRSRSSAPGNEPPRVGAGDASEFSF
jgi:hypothetical protein